MKYILVSSIFNRGIMGNVTKTIALLIIILNVSCKDANAPLTAVNSKVNEHELRFTSIFDSYELIKVKHIVLGNMLKLFEINNNLVVWVSSGEYRVHVFNKESQELTSLAKIGNGPTELRSINDVYIKGNKIFILDGLHKKLIGYTIEGRVVSEISLPDYCDHIFPIDDSSYVLYKKMNYNSLNEYKLNIYRITNKQFNLVSQYLPLKKVEEERDFMQTNCLYESEGKVMFTQPFSDIIYSITGTSVNPVFKLDFGNDKLPIDEYYNHKLNLGDFVTECKRKNYIWNINCVLENNNRLFFTFRQGESKILASIFNKMDNSTFTFSSFHDDIFSGLHYDSFSPEFMPLSITKEAMYFVVEPFFLLDKYKDISSHTDSVKLLKQYEWVKHLKPEDNTIILKCTFNAEK